MYFLKDTTELLHFLKGTDVTFSKSFLSVIKKEHKQWCYFANHKPGQGVECYVVFQHETQWIKYIEYFVLITRYVTGDNRDYQSSVEIVNILANPEFNKTSEDFVKNLNQLINIVKQVEERVTPKLTQLTCIETKRLGEAISCLQSDCFMASTVMSASAVESRIHYLIKKKNKTLYEEHFKDATLGGLLKLFNKNEYKDIKFTKLKSLIPEKHQSLLDIINTYRIFSAHPKTEEVDYRIADTIINLAFLFLLDPELKITDKKILKH